MLVRFINPENKRTGHAGLKYHRMLDYIVRKNTVGPSSHSIFKITTDAVIKAGRKRTRIINESCKLAPAF